MTLTLSDKATTASEKLENLKCPDVFMAPIFLVIAAGP